MRPIFHRPSVPVPCAQFKDGKCPDRAPGCQSERCPHGYAEYKAACNTDIERRASELSKLTVIEQYHADSIMKKIRGHKCDSRILRT